MPSDMPTVCGDSSGIARKPQPADFADRENLDDNINGAANDPGSNEGLHACQSARAESSTRTEPLNPATGSSSCWGSPESTEGDSWHPNSAPMDPTTRLPVVNGDDAGLPEDVQDDDTAQRTTK